MKKLITYTHLQQSVAQSNHCNPLHQSCWKLSPLHCTCSWNASHRRCISSQYRNTLPATTKPSRVIREHFNVCHVSEIWYLFHTLITYLSLASTARCIYYSSRFLWSSPATVVVFCFALQLIDLRSFIAKKLAIGSDRRPPTEKLTYSWKPFTSHIEIQV